MHKKNKLLIDIKKKPKEFLEFKKYPERFKIKFNGREVTLCGRY